MVEVRKRKVFRKGWIEKSFARKNKIRRQKVWEEEKQAEGQKATTKKDFLDEHENFTRNLKFLVMLYQSSLEKTVYNIFENSTV